MSEAAGEQLKAGKPFRMHGVEWLVKRGERPVSRRRGKARGAGRQVHGLGVEKVWIIYANGAEVWHTYGQIKQIQPQISQMGGLIGQEKSTSEILRELDKMAKERARDIDTWSKLYPELNLKDTAVESRTDMGLSEARQYFRQILVEARRLPGKKMLDKAVHLYRMLLRQDTVRPRQAEILHVRAEKAVAAIVKLTGNTAENVREQLEAQARKLGGVIPRVGQDI